MPGALPIRLAVASQDMPTRLSDIGHALLAARCGVIHIDVFGPFARGEQRPDSDVGLIVEVAEPTLETVFGSEEYLSGLLGRKADTGSFASLRARVRSFVARERVHVWSS